MFDSPFYQNEEFNGIAIDSFGAEKHADFDVLQIANQNRNETCELMSKSQHHNILQTEAFNSLLFAS